MSELGNIYIVLYIVYIEEELIGMEEKPEPLLKVGQILWKCTKYNEVKTVKVTRVEWIEPLRRNSWYFSRALCIWTRYRYTLF